MGHSTGSGRTQAEQRRNSAELLQTFREATARRQTTEARNEELRGLEREIRQNGYAYYRGYGIEQGIYGDGDVTVQYAGDDIFFDSISAARDFIDEVSNESQGRQRRR